MMQKTKKKVNSEILAVMFIDIASYTRTTARLSREKVDYLHEVFDNLSLPLFKDFRGQVVKKMGDAFLITFKSATDAVLCGVELQRRFMEYNKTHDYKPISIRVAIDMGEVIIRNDDVYGDAVNRASRIESVAKAGHIVFSEAVGAAMNKNEVQVINLGVKRFKGVKRPIRLLRVKSRISKSVKQRRKIKRLRKSIISLIIKIGLLFIISLIIYFILAYFFKISSISI